MFDGRDTIVMFDKIAYEDLLPVHWRPQTEPVSDLQAQQFAERNLRVLQACDALEEQGRVEKADDQSPHSADIMRLDLKLNLLLDVVGQLLTASQQRPQSVQIRFNAMGAHFAWPQPLAVGARGIIEVTLRDIVVQPLHLPAEVVAGAPAGLTRVRFLSLGENVADHIEKLVFRRHRRKIAGARQQSARK
ncbi:MAG TPA: PilZ domain-containing protein [Steroidobacteraceae bacterium]|nr:PilZ domain-containing protein [Steroidobacteraceae bacterium]